MRPVVSCVAVLAAANVMNNRIARRWAPVTSSLATAALLAIARRDGLTSAELGFERARRGTMTGGCLAAAVAGAYAAGICLPRTRPLFHDERALSLSRGRLLEEVLVQVPVGTVLLEEVAFRGVLPALLARRSGPRTAAAVASGMFGLWHVLPAVDMARANPALGRLTAGEDLESAAAVDVRAKRRGRPDPDLTRLVGGTVVATSAAGLLFSGLRHRGGLLAPALLHIATNAFGYLAARTARRLDDARTRRPA